MDQESQIRNDNLIITKEQKNEIRPYRKMQLIIIIEIIVALSFAYILFSLNHDLSSYMKQDMTLTNEYINEKERQIDIEDLVKRVDANYYGILELDKEVNTDLIRSFNELTQVIDSISKGDDVQFGVCYKATIHGDNAKDFIDNCGGISPLLFIIETTNGYRFGAFTTLPLNGANEYNMDENAFLFSFDTGKKYKVLRPESAVGDFKGKFPMFGRNDIIIENGFLSNEKSFTEFPKAYEEDVNAPGDYVLNGGLKNFGIKELEVLVCYINQM